MRNALACLIAAGTLAALAPVTASAQTVYKWKDAKGVTHYSERPPASGKYSQQDATRDPVAAQPAAKADAAAPKADSRCTTARSNLATLQNKAPVQIDTDNDGKPDHTLSDEERNGQIELARSTLKAYNCTETAAG